MHRLQIETVSDVGCTSRSKRRAFNILLQLLTVGVVLALVFHDINIREFGLGTITDIEEKKENLPQISWDSERGNGVYYPRNLRIAFIGDSLTRFQYYSLVSYLKMGHYANETSAKLFDSHRYDNWKDWMGDSIAFMQPFEHCDCYRGGDYNESAGSWWDMTNENRYYFDRAAGNHVTFLNKFGKSPVNGHWSPKDVYTGPVALEQDKFTPYSYRHNWSEAIVNLLGELQPKPEFVVLNAGLHLGHDLVDPAVQESIFQALKQTGMTGIFKTTTYTRPEVKSHGKSLRYDRQHDADMCHKLGHCLNMSWTLMIPMEHFVDQLHFDYQINNVMVQQLLHYLKHEFQTDGPDLPPNPLISFLVK